MSNQITNYDGWITTTPQQLIYPETVAEIQAVMRDRARFPSPVRAMGSYHSLTPCASSDGTVLKMSRMSKVLNIDPQKNELTAQAGLQFIDASKALREKDLQFMTNIEIGNMTLGASACCHTKDALDGVEFGQVSSYIKRIKWVTPNGDLAEASEDKNPDLLRKVRTSYGLCGVIYEVTFQIKPIEAVHFTYTPRPIKDLTQSEVAQFMQAEGLICWTVENTAVFQRRSRVTDPGSLGLLFGAARRRLWNHTEATIGRTIAENLSSKGLQDFALSSVFRTNIILYEMLHVTGGITLWDPDKTVDYRNTPQESRYAFTFWAFPAEQWLENLRAYLVFADNYFKKTGFRCNMPMGAYHIRKDTHALLSYSNDGEIFSLDPIHAPSDLNAWHDFLKAFNEFAYERNGIPLLNQSPFVERKHVERAYGARWQEFSDWVREVDPDGRMLNPYFADLLSAKKTVATT